MRFVVRSERTARARFQSSGALRVAERGRGTLRDMESLTAVRKLRLHMRILVDADSMNVGQVHRAV
jgi:hypothetical protein